MFALMYCVPTKILLPAAFVGFALQVIDAQRANAHSTFAPASVAPRCIQWSYYLTSHSCQQLVKHVSSPIENAYSGHTNLTRVTAMEPLAAEFLALLQVDISPSV